MAGRTFDLFVALGDTGFLTDLSAKFRSGAINGIVNGERAAFNGHRNTFYDAVSAADDPDVGDIYSGAECDAIEALLPFAADPWCAIVDKAGAFFYLLGAFVPGMPETGPTTAPITRAIPMRASAQRRGYAGVGSLAVTPFEFAQNDLTQNVGGALTSGTELALVVTDYPPSEASANITFAGRAQAVEGVGIWKLPALAADVAAATVVSAHGLGAGEEIKGYALAGERLGI